jgi:hypothetical protein
VRRDSFTKEWKQYEKLIIAPANAAFATVICHAQADWGKRSYFTDLRFAKAEPAPVLWDMRFDHLDNGWINDRSPYRNDGQAYGLALDDLQVTQSGGAIQFNNRKAKVRFLQSQSLAPTLDEWVLVAQFFLEEPVAPIDEPPAEAGYNLLGAPHTFGIIYRQTKDKQELVFSSYAYNDDGTVAGYPALILPIEPWKWCRFTLIVNNQTKTISGRLLVDGRETQLAETKFAGRLKTPPFLYAGVMDYPRGGNTPYPWGFWGRLDYLKAYRSIAAYEADQKNLVFGGWGK